MTTRYCAWIEKQGICRLEDGTYLVRPLGRIPLVYQVSATTKGRFVTIRAASLLIGTIAAVGIFLWPRMPVEMLLNLLTLVLAFMLAAMGLELYILHAGVRVPTDRWPGPADSFTALPRRVQAIILVLYAVSLIWLADFWVRKYGLGAFDCLVIGAPLAGFIYGLVRFWRGSTA